DLPLRRGTRIRDVHLPAIQVAKSRLAEGSAQLSDALRAMNEFAADELVAAICPDDVATRAALDRVVMSVAGVDAVVARAGDDDIAAFGGAIDDVAAGRTRYLAAAGDGGDARVVVEDADGRVPGTAGMAAREREDVGGGRVHRVAGDAAEERHRARRKLDELDAGRHGVRDGVALARPAGTA